MASPPWISQQHPPTERPWTGMAMLMAIPLLSLVLIRMLWSGSGLWFLTVGLILLGVAAVTFLARRPQGPEHGQALAQESNRLPLVLAGIGALFLAMLLLPNFASGDGAGPAALSQDRSTGLTSQVSGVQQHAPTAQAAAQQPAAHAQPTARPSTSAAAQGSQTYTVLDGDTLWDIATRFGVTVDAIIAANNLANPSDIHIDQTLVIPAPDASATPAP